jgi:phosphate transport system substrate-binding protein
MGINTPHAERVAGLARRLVLGALVIVCATAGAGSQAPADIAVVVNPSVAVDNLSIAELRRILLGDREFWSAGARVTLLIRAPIARERDAVVRDVCQMTEAQFRQHWIGKVFRADTPSGPKIVYSNEMAIDQVSRTPGAITFIQAPVTNKAVKVLRIDGRAPGQQGYRLR